MEKKMYRTKILQNARIDSGATIKIEDVSNGPYEYSYTIDAQTSTSAPKKSCLFQQQSLSADQIFEFYQLKDEVKKLLKAVYPGNDENQELKTKIKNTKVEQMLENYAQYKQTMQELNNIASELRKKRDEKVTSQPRFT